MKIFKHYVKFLNKFDSILYSHVDFPPDEGHFVALGVSEDDRMGNDLAFVCMTVPSDNKTKLSEKINRKVTYTCFSNITITLKIMKHLSRIS